MNYSIKDAKEWARETLTGYFLCPTTPFRDDMSLDEEGLRRNVAHLLGLRSTNGLYVNSVFGEPLALTLAERKRTAAIIIEEVRGRVPVLVEVSAESYLDAIDLANHSRDCGADLVMLGAPLTGLRTREGVLDYFRRVAAETEIGISVFTTSWTDVGFHITADMLLELAELDAVCMVKDATLNLFEFYDLLARVGPRIVVSRPSEQHWLAGRLVMGAALCPPLFMGTLRPVYCDPLTKSFEDAVKNEDWRAAAAAMLRVAGLSAEIAKNHAKGHHEVTMSKAITSLFGMAAGPVRPPLTYPDQAELLAARTALEHAGMLSATVPA